MSDEQFERVLSTLERVGSDGYVELVAHYQLLSIAWFACGVAVLIGCAVGLANLIPAFKDAARRNDDMVIGYGFGTAITIIVAVAALYGTAECLATVFSPAGYAIRSLF